MQHGARQAKLSHNNFQMLFITNPLQFSLVYILKTRGHRKVRAVENATGNKNKLQIISYFNSKTFGYNTTIDSKGLAALPFMPILSEQIPPVLLAH